MTDILYFKKQAKFLQKDFLKNQYEAVARFDTVFKNQNHTTLMNFQHVIAREASFNDWNELNKANTQKLAMAKVLFYNPTLNGTGARFNWQVLLRLPLAEQIIKRWEFRRELLDNYAFLTSLSVALKKHITPIISLNKEINSYPIRFL